MFRNILYTEGYKPWLVIQQPTDFQISGSLQLQKILCDICLLHVQCMVVSCFKMTLKILLIKNTKYFGGKM